MILLIACKLGTETMNKKIIEVNELGVSYRMPDEPIAGVKDFFVKALKSRLRVVDFWALRDVSFSVEKGESLGILGVNGAGKSTLLKVIARVLAPKEGRVVVRGRVFPLLELGAGFHLDLSGHENIYLYGNILGFSNGDITKMYDEIVEFSELSEFLHAPLRAYSSGMVTRLGFAIATAVQPDILLADEILSVGDAAFQEKCMKRMNEYLSNGTTILYVSHSPESVRRICKKGLWLERGKVKMYGDATDVAVAYGGGERVITS